MDEDGSLVPDTAPDLFELQQKAREEYTGAGALIEKTIREGEGRVCACVLIVLVCQCVYVLIVCVFVCFV